MRLAFSLRHSFDFSGMRASCFAASLEAASRDAMRPSRLYCAITVRRNAATATSSSPALRVSLTPDFSRAHSRLSDAPRQKRRVFFRYGGAMARRPRPIVSQDDARFRGAAAFGLRRGGDAPIFAAALMRYGSLLDCAFTTLGVVHRSMRVCGASEVEAFISLSAYFRRAYMFSSPPR